MPSFFLRHPALPALIFLLVAGLSLVPNQVLFVGSWTGWWAYGVVAIASLFLAGFSSSRTGLLAVIIALATALTPDALPYSYGLLFLAGGWVIAESSAVNLRMLSVARWLSFSMGLWCVGVVAWWYVVTVSESEGLLEQANWMAGTPWLQRAFPSMVLPLGHANYTSGLGVMLAPLFCGWALSRKESALVRAAFGFFAVAAVILIVGGGSRAGFLAPAVVALGAVFTIKSRWFSFRRKLVMGSLIFGATAVGLLIHPHFRQWWSNPESIGYSDLVRWDYLRGSWEMFLDAPYFGQGSGAIPLRFAAFTGGEAEHFACYQAHSTPFQWLAEFGLFGGLFSLVVLVGSGWALIRALRIPSIDSRALGVVCAMASYAVFSLWDYQANIPLIGMLWGVLLGTCAALFYPRRPGANPRRISAVSIGCWVAAAATLLMLSREWNARRQLHDAMAQVETAVPAAARTMADAVSYGRVPAGVEVAAALIFERYAASSPSAPVLDAVNAAWARAVEKAPDYPGIKTWAGVSALTRDPPAAARWFKASLLNSPKQELAWRGLVEAYVRSGDITAATEALALSLMVRPEFAGDPALRSGALRIDNATLFERFERLANSYAQAYPTDAYAVVRLPRVLHRLKAWSESDAVPYVLSQRHPEVIEGCDLSRLSAVIGSEPDSASRRLKSWVYLSHGHEMSDDECAALLRSFSSKTARPYDGVRTVLTSEPTFALGSYLGASDAAWLGLPMLKREDLFFSPAVFHGETPRLRVDAEFLKAGLRVLP